MLTACTQKIRNENLKYKIMDLMYSANQSAVSAFDLNSFIFLNLLFSVISENSFPEEERQTIKDLLFFLEKCNVSESAKRELTVFCDGLPRTYLVPID
jgi:uncharacterized membrane protein